MLIEWNKSYIRFVFDYIYRKLSLDIEIAQASNGFIIGGVVGKKRSDALED